MPFKDFKDYEFRHDVPNTILESTGSVPEQSQSKIKIRTTTDSNDGPITTLTYNGQEIGHIDWKDKATRVRITGALSLCFVENWLKAYQTSTSYKVRQMEVTDGITYEWQIMRPKMILYHGDVPLALVNISKTRTHVRMSETALDLGLRNTCIVAATLLIREDLWSPGHYMEHGL